MSTSPASVVVAPSLTLCQASRMTPKVAIAAPIALCAWSRSPRNAIARPMVKKTWSWITSDDRPAGMPSFMPRNSNPNWNTPIAKP